MPLPLEFEALISELVIAKDESSAPFSKVTTIGLHKLILGCLDYYLDVLALESKSGRVILDMVSGLFTRL